MDLGSKRIADSRHRRLFIGGSDARGRRTGAAPPPSHRRHGGTKRRRPLSVIRSDHPRGRRCDQDLFRVCRFLRRSPGPPPFSSMNSIPPASNTRWMASTVRSFSSSPRSNRATVSTDTLAAAASSRTPQPKAARAIRHCTGKKIITLL